MTTAPLRGRWLREPLLHFLVIGAGIFLLYHFVRGGNETAPREIVISESRIEALGENFQRTWMRPPTPQELRGLVDDYVKEEVFYREAVAMGLDRDDTVIRRRLRQKMEFVSEDTAAAEPNDTQLRQFMAAHPDDFSEPERVTFEQVFVNVEKRGVGAKRDAERILGDLRAGRGPKSPAEAGDPTLLPAALEAASPQDISGSFGDEFGKQLDSVPIGQWVGPVTSTFGLHLVRVTARTPSAAPELANVRPAVLREWQAQQRAKSGDAFYASLRSKYDVRYEGEIGRILQQTRKTADGVAGK
jgi:hypothetical protein